MNTRVDKREDERIEEATMKRRTERVESKDKNNPLTGKLEFERKKNIMIERDRIVLFFRFVFFPLFSSLSISFLYSPFPSWDVECARARVRACV